MTALMKQNVTPDPCDVLLLGAVAIVTQTQLFADLVERAGRSFHAAFLCARLTA